MIVEILNEDRSYAYYDILEEFLGGQYILKRVGMPLEALESAEDEAMSHVSRVLEIMYEEIKHDLVWKFLSRDCCRTNGILDGDYLDTYKVTYQKQL